MLPLTLVIDDNEPGDILLNNIIVHLQPKTYSLIRLLAEQPMHIYRWELIYNRLWPNDVVEEQQLYYQTRKLRAALDKRPCLSKQLELFDS